MKTKIAVSIIFSGALGAGIVLATSGTVSAAGISIQLQQESRVSGAAFALGEIAHISGSPAGLVARLKAVDMGRSPYPGQSLSVDADQVRFRMRVAKIDPAGVQISDSVKTRVVRSSQKVDSAQLVAAAKDAVMQSWQGSERLECEVTRPPQEIAVSAGSLELVAQASSAPRAGLCSVPVDIHVDGQKERSVSVSLNVHVFTPVVVATRALARGQTVEAGDLSVEERDLGTTGASVLTDVAMAAGLRTMRAIPSGAILRQADLEVAPLVHRNGPVVITAVSGRVRIRSNGQALDEGQLGQLVRVRPDHSKDSVTAKVTGEGTVELAM